MPHQGLMSAAVFEQSLARVVELRDQTQTDVLVAFCGTGEPLLNPGRVAYLEQVRKAGFDCVISSNGALLDEGVGRALLEAGLRKICLNVSELGAAYEKVYGLPFERTRDNVARFVQMAGDECEVFVVIVDYTDNAAHVSRKMDYWRAFGVQRFIRYDLINRGGSLAVNGMEFDRQPQG
jgi:MoaA/NifB/PqqE/SkfB family radical SAM enzyme